MFFSFQLKIIEVLVFLKHPFIWQNIGCLVFFGFLLATNEVLVVFNICFFGTALAVCLVFFWVSADSLVFPQNFVVFGLKLVVWCFLVPLGKAVGVEVDSDLIIALANA